MNIEENIKPKRKCQKRYNESQKGIAARNRYRESDKWKAIYVKQLLLAKQKKVEAKNGISNKIPASQFRN